MILGVVVVAVVNEKMIIPDIELSRVMLLLLLSKQKEKHNDNALSWATVVGKSDLRGILICDNDSTTYDLHILSAVRIVGMLDLSGEIISLIIS